MLCISKRIRICYFLVKNVFFCISLLYQLFNFDKTMLYQCYILIIQCYIKYSVYTISWKAAVRRYKVADSGKLHCGELADNQIIHRWNLPNKIRLCLACDSFSTQRCSLKGQTLPIISLHKTKKINIRDMRRRRQEKMLQTARLLYQCNWLWLHSRFFDM